MPPRRAKGKAAKRPAPASSRSTGYGGYGSRVATAPPPPRRKPSGPPSKLATLPQALFHQILTYVVSDIRPTPEQPLSIARLDLHGLAMVSKAWRGHATELASQLTLGKTIVHIKKGTKQELLDVRYKLTLGQPFLRELWLAVTPPSMSVNAETTQWLDRLARFLAASLRCAPRLELLDLRNFCGASEHVATIVRAAATFCPQLQALILPADLADSEAGRVHGIKMNSPDLQPMYDAVLHGLQQWHHHGTTGGLHQLRLPSRPTTNRHTNSVDFLTRVRQHCPNIELLDAYTWLAGSNVSRDQYIVDRATWDAFCSTCTNLRAFDWIVAPYATEFFEIFGKYRKPQLTALSLTAQRPWDWDKYYADVGDEEAAAVRAAGVGKAAQRVYRLLRGCPALKKLDIKLHSPAQTGGVGPAPGNLFANLGSMDVLAAATKNSMNNQLFGDDFIDALATYCPLVEQITIVHDDAISEFFATQSYPILSFTDLALRRLASLRFLQSLETITINASGKGVFDLVNSAVNEAPGQREFSIALGDDTGASEMAFYRALEGFLRCLHQHDGPLQFTNKKLVLHVTNSKTKQESKRWSETYLKRLKHGMKEIRAKFPTLHFRIEVEGLTKSSFKRILSFGMFTVTAKPMNEHGWRHAPRGALVDGVFLKHELCMQDDYGYGGGYDDAYDYDYGGFEGGGGRGDYYGDYENERGFYGMGGYNFFNGLQLDDSFHDDFGDGDDGYDY